MQKGLARVRGTVLAARVGKGGYTIFGSKPILQPLFLISALLQETLLPGFSAKLQSPAERRS